MSIRWVGRQKDDAAVFGFDMCRAEFRKAILGTLDSVGCLFLYPWMVSYLYLIIDTHGVDSWVKGSCVGAIFYSAFGACC